MVDVPDSLQCLVTASVTGQNGSYRIEIPREEVELGELDVGEFYRVGVLTHTAASSPSESPDAAPSAAPQEPQVPPVDEGEVREVTIETLGEEGDGIAKVERGYIIIVDGGQPGETVTVNVHTVRQNVAFAEIVPNDV
ncbi:Predicted RNA-binding protein, contains TRAM domain [Halogranum amylolyticum]|uniref:Predicted RNA-binding protein, contains TRAM domain n=1 Tax=Halogranum amylolyticum TaxID=660520 RepID=A0A1H8V4I7_9EURY|nr:TRAM domain-containing protein [Halogranum amylolyticum]SEP10412.1 Predicted RNA-binding protein, contains TRAM domain [Halogranum amylolyticum]